VHAQAAAEPKPLPLHVQVAAREVMTGPPVNSRLGAIVTAYLRQQHRAACLTAAQPVSVVPPVSLLKPYSLPVASRPLNAPANVTLRLGRQEVWGGFGGRGACVRSCAAHAGARARVCVNSVVPAAPHRARAVRPHPCADATPARPRTRPRAMHAGGAAATRRLVWSRYRLTQMLRDDGPLLTACAFLRGFEVLVAGTASGELKLHDAYKCVA
jgi:hypothetical protein